MSRIGKLIALLSCVVFFSFGARADADAAIVTTAAAPAAPAPAQSQCSAMGVAWDGYMFWAGCPTFSCQPTDCQAEECRICGELFCNCPNNNPVCKAHIAIRDDGTVDSVECFNGTCRGACRAAGPQGNGVKFYFCKC
ncbi:MAG: hypothetical protein R3F56_08960 [Planctomycetota bacterium]